MKINSRSFNFNFFLSEKTKVNSLDEAAKIYGGATKNIETGEIFSNVPGSEFIEIKTGELNTLSVYIPDTINVNETIELNQHQEIVQKIITDIYHKYGSVPTYENGLGSWFSDELNHVVYDNIIIASIELENIKKSDINFFIGLAQFIKQQMKQEGVTIAINTAMAIV
jgi:hypothetical protein